MNDGDVVGCYRPCADVLERKCCARDEEGETEKRQSLKHRGGLKTDSQTSSLLAQRFRSRHTNLHQISFSRGLLCPTYVTAYATSLQASSCSRQEASPARNRRSSVYYSVVASNANSMTGLSGMPAFTLLELCEARDADIGCVFFFLETEKGLLSRARHNRG